MSTLHRMLAAIAAMVLAGFLAACGGGGGAGGQGTSGGGGGATDAAALDVVASSSSIGSDGRTVATISAFVKNSANLALANQLVEFGTSDAGAVLQVTSARTDATGSATATLRISDQTNRSIVINVRTGGLTGSVAVSVIGTTVTLNGPNSLVANAPTEFTIGLRDSSGAVLVGKTVTIASSAGNALSASSAVTDSAGQARVTLTGTRIGADTLTVSALGAVTSAALQVSGTQIAFAAPLAGQEIPVATDQPVTVTYTLGGAVQAGQRIQFATTRGTLSASEAVTDGKGQASVTVRSGTAGIATVTAIAGSLLGSQKVEFVSRDPAKLALQASPANVGVNLSPASTNASQLIAVVRDAADNPVKGQPVAFSAVSDPSNGRVEPAVATTDSAGVATVAFFPGANSSGFNQVVMKAKVVSADPAVVVEGTTTLTASMQELMVRVGTGNVATELDAATNAMPWSAVVTDASGNPVSGASVQASLVSIGFRKGYYVKGALEWFQVVQDSCVSEDLNGNLRLDAGEDANGDGALTPGNVAATVVTSTGGRTDSNGLARLNVIYPKSFGAWTTVRLRVTITVIAGTEGSAESRFLLPVLAKDLALTVTPPGQPSPFGQLPGCDNTN